MCKTTRRLLLLATTITTLCGIVQGTAWAEEAAQGSGTAEAKFYVVDVGHGNAVFVTAPSGEVMLLDTGTSRTANRVLAFMEQHGIGKIDYLLISHFEEDHMGAAPAIAEKVPVGCFVDHGECVTYGKHDDWWHERRAPSFKVGMAKRIDEGWEAYRKARSGSRHQVVKPGDRVPIQGLDVVVVTAAGKAITEPLPGGGIPNPGCAATDHRAVDDAEDGQSVGVVVQYGKFRFVDLGDLTWSVSAALFCPKNLVGTVDAYVVTHHAQSLPRELGEYYYGISSCTPAEVLGLSPRAAILTMGGVGHLHGNGDAMKTVHSVPGLDLWQTEFVREGGEKDHNAPEQFIANLGTRSEKVPSIEVSAHADGSFTVTNGRNDYTKKYPPRQTALYEQEPSAAKSQSKERKKKTEPRPVRAAAGVRVETDVAYLGPERKEKLDIYLPAGAKQGESLPCVVDIHGGGFLGGDKSDTREQEICNTLAQRGYVAASINYYLPAQDQLSGFPQNIHECKTAIRFLRKNASRYGIDPAHMAAIGGSAGGYFAAILLVTKDGDALDPKGPYAEVSCQIQAAVDMYGPVDLLADPSTAQGTTVEKFLTRVQSTWPRERIEVFSPAHYVNPAMPPILVTHGTKDPSVAISQSERFVELLQKAGATYYYFPIADAGHSFNLESSGADLRDTVTAFFDKYLKGRNVEIPAPTKTPRRTASGGQRN